jgi:hypothetical protein
MKHLAFRIGQIERTKWSNDSYFVIEQFYNGSGHLGCQKREELRLRRSQDRRQSCWNRIKNQRFFDRTVFKERRDKRCPRNCRICVVSTPTRERRASVTCSELPRSRVIHPSFFQRGLNYFRSTRPWREPATCQSAWKINATRDLRCKRRNEITFPPRERGKAIYSRALAVGERFFTFTTIAQRRLQELKRDDTNGYYITASKVFTFRSRMSDENVYSRTSVCKDAEERNNKCII